MERALEDESTSLDDRPPDDSNDDECDFVEVDPSGRYGRYEEVLGKGAYKTVYKAFDEVDGIEVAWNQVKVQDMLQNPGDVEHLYSELHLLKMLKHKNIIKFYNSWVDIDSNNVNFITEIFTSGTLRQYCKKHRHVDLKAVKSWSRQILRGLLYLHSHDPPIIHRDLKCDNIFINGNQGEVKIGDLGLAAILQQAHAAHSVLGTPEFMAPELYEEEYNELVDIYSFGMCLLEMITSEYPYSECANAAQIYKKVTLGKRPAALDKVRDPQVREFVEKCLASAPQRRHARELLNDPFLKVEGEIETVEPLPYQSITLKTSGDLKELNAVPEDSLSHCTLRYSEQETMSAFQDIESSQGGEKLSFSSSNIIMLEGGDKGCNDSAYEMTQKRSDSPNSKEEGSKRNKDFRIKGKKQDDKKILVRIQITNLRDEVRYIQFDFDVEGDTAMCVASEMVAEIDLSDQDATTIAEMIDSEILALVPDWKPGVGLDQVWGDKDFSAEHGRTLLGDSPVMQMHSDGLSPRVFEMHSTNGVDKKTSTSPKLGDFPRNDGYMYGRFEDVGYRHTGSDHRQESDTFAFFSDSSDKYEVDESELSLDSSVGGPHMRSVIDDQLSSQPFEEIRVDIPIDVGSSGSVMESMDGLLIGGCPGFEPSQEPPMVCNEADLRVISSVMSQVKIEQDVEAEELRLLTLQHEQEIQSLRCKHEQALLDLKIRLQGRHGLAMRRKVVLGDPMQSTPGLVGLPVSANRSGCQSRTDIESQCIPVEANVNMEHERGYLEAATVAFDLGMLEVENVELKIGPVGLSPSHSLGYKVNNRVNLNDLVSQAERLSLEKSSNGNSEPHTQGKFDSANREGKVNNRGNLNDLVSQAERLSLEKSSNGNFEPHTQGKFDSANREGHSWNGGSSETHIISVESDSRLFANASSLRLGEEPKALMVSHPISKTESPEAVVVSGRNQSCTALNGPQEATFDITGKENLILSVGPDLEQKQTESSDGQNVRGKLDIGSNCTEKKKAALFLEKRDVPSHSTAKMERSTLAKRESYLEFYKAGVIRKDKLSSSKPSDFVANGEISAKATSSKSNDLEQLKNVQLQKSIAELEARTLEGLCQSSTKYLVGNAVKNYGNSNVRGGQTGSVTTLAR